jgi:hypothetical protein
MLPEDIFMAFSKKKKKENPKTARKRKSEQWKKKTPLVRIKLMLLLYSEPIPHL